MLLGASCGGEEPAADGARTLETHHVFVPSSGRIELVGIGRKGERDAWCKEEGNASEFLVARLDESGRITGETSIPQSQIEGCADDLSRAAYDEQERLEFTGSFSEWPGLLPGGDGGPKQSSVVARFDADGSFDESYDGDGVAVNPDDASHIGALAQAPAPGGGALVLEERDPYEGGVRLVRVGRAGKLVPGFGGLVPGIPRRADYTMYSAWDLAVDQRRGIYGFARFLRGDESGKIVHVLFRHRARDGKPDRTFGFRGSVDPSPRDARYWAVYDFALQPDGKPLVAGVLERQRRLKLFAARFTPAGKIDPSFGRHGLVELDLGRSFGDDRDWLSSVALDPSGRIVLSVSLNGRDTSLFRLLGDGRLDESFGKQGRVVVPRL